MSQAEAYGEGSDAVIVERRGTVMVATINRPNTRNALSTEVLNGIVSALDEAEYDAEVRAVVITGGTKLFASGADIRELKTLTPAAYQASARQHAFTRIAEFPKPIIAAVAGYVLGGGCEIALSTDFIIAADNAILGQPEINLGILPGAGGTQRWARVVGRYRAAEIVLAARNIDAWSAYELGMVNEVVPAEFVIEAAVKKAETVARFSPIAARSTKAAVRMSEEVGMSAGLGYEKAQLGILLSTQDHFEGIDAFLEKRPASFTGE